MKFTVEINLGNDAAQTAEEIAWMLHTSIVRRIGDDQSELPIGAFGNVHDRNGNTVGIWKVDEQD